LIGFDIDTIPYGNMPMQSYDYTNRPITRWDYNPVTRVQELQNQTNQQLKQFGPILQADFFETPTDYHVHVDLPGVNAADLEVDILPDKLIITADRKFVDSLNSNNLHFIYIFL
jgi:HSP20 family molecular chaperone IbpA